jgi:hypothetical protein
MTASATDIARLRRMTQATVQEYSDALLGSMLEAYPLPDLPGHFPDESGWIARYDLNAAAADIWDEKAAALAADYDFMADGSIFYRSQAYKQAVKQANYIRDVNDLEYDDDDVSN